jgi:hypothetical protein
MDRYGPGDHDGGVTVTVLFQFKLMIVSTQVRVLTGREGPTSHKIGTNAPLAKFRPTTSSLSWPGNRPISESLIRDKDI